MAASIEQGVLIWPDITGVNCFDLEPGHIPEIPRKEEPKNIYIVEERIEENSLHETIGKFKHIPPHFRPE